MCPLAARPNNQTRARLAIQAAGDAKLVELIARALAHGGIPMLYYANRTRPWG
jgi:hypothetical protein